VITNVIAVGTSGLTVTVRVSCTGATLAADAVMVICHCPAGRSTACENAPLESIVRS
jgi:hypothetical protein